jgi:D-lactate dehydrogenase (cytochrome)
MGLEEFFSHLRNLGIPVSRNGFEDYLTDESRFRGRARALIRARDKAQVVAAVNAARVNRVRLNVVSGKTSLTGSSVPMGGVILDVRSLDAIDRSDPSRVEPGVITKHYRDHVGRLGLFFPPDPTSEDSCTLGGNVACNASGALSYFYGPTRQYVRGLTVALATGSVISIDRGQVTGVHDRLTIPRHLLTPQPDADLVVPVPRHAGPSWERCKNSAGLYANDPMDLVDLFIGSEGILGVFLEVRTILLPRRNPYVALLIHPPSRDVTVALVHLLDALKEWSVCRDHNAKENVERRLRVFSTGAPQVGPESYDAVVPACMEWMGASVTPLLAAERARPLKDSYGCLYVEQEYRPDLDPLTVIAQWADLVNMVSRFTENRIHTEVALDEKQIRQMRQERKSIPERLNQMIRPGLVKIGLDFAVPKERLGWLMELYDRVLPSRGSYSFGHIGNAHLHVNLVPETEDEEQAYRKIYRSVAREVCAVGGTVSAEHGIGKLKHEALEMMLGPEGMSEIAQVKRIFDPACILNVGNMVVMQCD